MTTRPPSPSFLEDIFKLEEIFKEKKIKLLAEVKATVTLFKTFAEEALSAKTNDELDRLRVQMNEATRKALLIKEECDNYKKFEIQELDDRIKAKMNEAKRRTSIIKEECDTKSETQELNDRIKAKMNEATRRTSIIKEECDKKSETQELNHRIKAKMNEATRRTSIIKEECDKKLQELDELTDAYNASKKAEGELMGQLIEVSDGRYESVVTNMKRLDELGSLLEELLDNKQLDKVKRVSMT